MAVHVVRLEVAAVCVNSEVVAFGRLSARAEKKGEETWREKEIVQFLTAGVSSTYDVDMIPHALQNWFFDIQLVGNALVSGGTSLSRGLRG